MLTYIVDIHQLKPEGHTFNQIVLDLLAHFNEGKNTEGRTVWCWEVRLSGGALCGLEHSDLEKSLRTHDFALDCMILKVEVVLWFDAFKFFFLI